MQRKKSIGGEISVGVIPTIAPYFVPPHRSVFSRRFPQARLSVVEEITPLLLERLHGNSAPVPMRTPRQCPGDPEIEPVRGA